jgi:cell wall-associated NlpC family hydrolase
MNAHWAAGLIGKPWSPDGEGPDDFYCWGLVRYALRIGYGVHMPELGVGDQSEGVAAVKRAATGWRVGPGPCGDGEIVVMNKPKKGRHCGLMVRDGSRLVLLHADGHLSTAGPVGMVRAHPLRDVLRDGFDSFEIWRRFG